MTAADTAGRVGRHFLTADNVGSRDKQANMTVGRQSVKMSAISVGRQYWPVYCEAWVLSLWNTHQLPPPRRICNHRCFSVSNFEQKLANGFASNFQGRLAMGQWTNG